MATKAGVWIDQKQAIVILVTDAGQRIKKIKAAVEQVGGGSGPKKYTPNDFIAGDKLGRKAHDKRKKLYDDVLACIQGTDSLLILGPGETKSEFSKHIKAKKIRGVVVEVETADRMTDQQLAAKVQQHFATSSAKKPVASNKTVKKVAKATVGKSPGKSGKKS